MVRTPPQVFENNPSSTSADARNQIEPETRRARSLCLESEMFQQAKFEAHNRSLRSIPQT